VVILVRSSKVRGIISQHEISPHCYGMGHLSAVRTK